MTYSCIRKYTENAIRQPTLLAFEKQQQHRTRNTCSLWAGSRQFTHDFLAYARREKLNSTKHFGDVTVRQEIPRKTFSSFRLFRTKRLQM
jgi:hypothetical protein